MSNWKAALAGRSDLLKYGDNDIGLFSLALKFGLDDLDTVASDSLTDGSDDKKIDMVYIDKEDRFAVITQCYKSRRVARSAPSNKASDLNTGVSWLFQRPIDELPAVLKPSASLLREFISEKSIDDIHVWYVHNLPESQNVYDELVTVEATLKAALKTSFPGIEVATHVLEVGESTLEEWYASTQSPILVNERFSLTIPNGFEIKGGKWTAFVTTMPAKYLYSQYKKYGTKLFSANVRDYLGSRKTDININYGIKKTAVECPEDFWVYNNGLTLLTNSYDVKKRNGRKYLSIEGLSIVNGAQTTGAIGSLPKTPVGEVLVPVRLVKTTDSETIFNIIQYNNSQNKISASDFRSRDRIQKRLKEEFDNIPDAEYLGGRRGGQADAIKRNPHLLPSYTVGQALAAINREPVVASNEKTNIWISDKLYSRYFNDDLTASHIVFAYSLLKAVESRKSELILKSRGSDLMTDIEKRELEYFRNRGAIYLLVSAVSSSLETIIGKRIDSISRLSFGNKISPSKAERIWRPVIKIGTPFCAQLGESFTHGLKNTELVRRNMQTFQSLVQATASANKEAFREFSSHIKMKRKQ
jgi:AIPR protein.